MGTPSPGRKPTSWAHSSLRTVLRVWALRGAFQLALAGADLKHAPSSVVPTIECVLIDTEDTFGKNHTEPSPRNLATQRELSPFLPTFLKKDCEEPVYFYFLNSLSPPPSYV